MSLIVHIQNFDHYMNLVAQEKRLVLLDFGATWCGPCRSLTPILDRLSLEHAENLLVLKVDVDEDKENNDEDMQLSSLFSVKNLPTIVFIQDGKMIPGDEYKIVGMNPSKLDQAIKNLLSKM